ALPISLVSNAWSAALQNPGTSGFTLNNNQVFQVYLDDYSYFPNQVSKMHFCGIYYGYNFICPMLIDAANDRVEFDGIKMPNEAPFAGQSACYATNGILGHCTSVVAVDRSC